MNKKDCFLMNKKEAMNRLRWLENKFETLLHEARKSEKLMVSMELLEKISEDYAVFLRDLQLKDMIEKTTIATYNLPNNPKSDE